MGLQATLLRWNDGELVDASPQNVGSLSEQSFQWRLVRPNCMHEN